MHHNLYKHNQVVNGGFVLDNPKDLQALFRKYQVKIDFAGHIHAQNIIGPSENCPTIEVASSCFCMTDQGYGVIKIKDNQLFYQRHSFQMLPYLTKKKADKLPTSNFHQYLFQIFASTNARQMSWLAEKVPDTTTREKILDLVLKLNWNFFVGHNQSSVEEMTEIKESKTYQVLADKLPELQKYLDSLLSIKQNSQQLTINF